MSDTTPRKLTIDIWSDVMCPWCSIGYGQLRKGLAALEGEIEAEVRWHAFELNPDMPQEGADREEYLRRKIPQTEEQRAAFRAQMAEIAEKAGVSLDYEGDSDPAPRAMMRNTFKAHKLLAHALERYGAEKQTAVKLALFAAHFNRRVDINDEEVLLDLAQGAGLDRKAAAAAFADEALSQRVRAEERQAYEMNITGVPAMVVEGKFLIPGAQAPEVYVDALRRVAERL